VSTPSQTRPRTLTEALRGLDRAALVAVLELRPDLSYPLPRDLAELSTRAGTLTSTGRALESLNAWQRDVCEAVAALPDPADVVEVADLMGQPADVVASAVDDLRQRLLLWGEDDQLHLVRAAREYFEPYPAGLAPPSPRPLSPTAIDSALADCDDSVRPVLERLAWSPTGAVRNADRPVSVQTARSPVEQLLARQLLRPLDAETVLLPREVALRLRRGRLFAEPAAPTPPAVTGRARSADLVDKAAAGAAFGLLHDIDLAVQSMESTPHRLLRTGGLSTRDVTTLGRNLGTDASHAGFVVEAAAAAGLVAPGSNLSLLPTPEYDRWVNRDGAGRWRSVVDAWARTTRYFSRSTEPGAHVLGPEADSATAPVLRQQLMRLAVGAGVGQAIDLDSLVAAVAWHRPRLARGAGVELATLVGWTWREAGWLGLSSLSAASSYAEVALAPDTPMPARLVDLFPAPVDRIIVQSDLTAVAPGPLRHAIASELRLLADQESRGGGGVYRFSAGSLRRGFDAGWSSAQMHAWLEQHSTTGVPQPLAYLIDDVARQYGSIRVGAALSYVRTEDDTQMAALLAHPDAGLLGLRSVAPGVLVSGADPYEVVSFLRGLGHTPAVEDESGRTISTPPQLRAAAARRDGGPWSITAAEAADAILAGEQRTGRPTPAQTQTATDSTLRLLQLATEAADAVRVAYVGPDGTPIERELTPLDLAAGVMRAVDRDGAQVVTIPLARISDVQPT
jgi:hypothetical protein